MKLLYLNIKQYKKFNGTEIFFGDYKENPIVIEKGTQAESFIYFFLKLLMELQKLATIPAMDIECYARALDSI